MTDDAGAASIPEVYVAGDVSRDVQLSIIAAAEGARAALAINSQLLRWDGYPTELERCHGVKFCHAKRI